MRLDGYLRAHSFMQVERPPLLWEVDADDEDFLRVLGEMIALGLRFGNELSDLVLNVSNVTVEPDPMHPERPPAPGDYVAVTVRGGGDWGEEVVWSPQAPDKLHLPGCVERPARSAGAAFGYSRRVDDGASVTVFFRRFQPS
jgi:hypothetical protein